MASIHIGTELPLHEVRRRLQEQLGRDLVVDALTAALNPTADIVGAVTGNQVVLRVNRGVTDSTAPVFRGVLDERDGCASLSGTLQLRAGVRVTLVAFGLVALLMLIAITYATLFGSLATTTALAITGSAFAILSLFAILFRLAIKSTEDRDAELIEKFLQEVLSARDNSDVSTTG